MKKWILLVVVLILTCSSLCACGSKDGFKRGTWQDDTYTNEFADIKFKLPENWIYATDEELAATMNLGEEVLNDKGKLATKIAEQYSVYDALAKNNSTGDNIIFTYENLNYTVGGNKLTEKQYAEELKSQLNSMTTMKYTFEEAYEVVLANQTYIALPTAIEGTNMKQIYYFRKIDNYMVGIVVTLVSPDFSVIEYFS